MNILLIDNRDSFTFNLAQAFERAGGRGIVVRNDIDAEAALDRAIAADAMILLSPGPGAPGEAGCCLDLIRLAKGVVPLIGICLGHQAIIAEGGGEVVRAHEPCHGRCSAIHHRGDGPFAGLPNPLTVGRYHSLCTPTNAVPGRFTIDAELDGMAMAVRDDEAGQIGLQFHPESILTPKGDRLVAAMLLWAEARQRQFATALAAA